MATESSVTFRRDQIQRLFGDDFEGLRQFELLIESVDELLNVGFPASGISVDTSGFNGLLSSADTTVQLALDTLDDVNTDDIPEGTTNFFLTQSRFDSYFAAKSTDDLSEGATNLYYTEERVDANRKDNILEYGFESVTSNTTVTKTKTEFTGTTTSQTITLPTAGTSGREVEVFNNGEVSISVSGSSVLSALYPNESACFTDTGVDWIA